MKRLKVVGRDGIKLLWRDGMKVAEEGWNKTA